MVFPFKSNNPGRHFRNTKVCLPPIMSAEVPTELTFDCVVVGSGHAGSCAALSARDGGCSRVLIVDKCPPEWVGGNGFFTAGAHRTVHGGLADLLPLVRNVPPAIADTIDMEPYTAEDFTKDINRLGNDRADPALVKAVVDTGKPTIVVFVSGRPVAEPWIADRKHLLTIPLLHLAKDASRCWSHNSAVLPRRTGGTCSC